MDYFFNILLIVLLVIIFVQDMKFRGIHFSLPILLAILGIYSLYTRGISYELIWYNLIFLTLTFFGLFTYLAFKNKGSVNLLKVIGLGDFLFFIAIAPFFSTTNFIVFFITGMFFTIILHSIFAKLLSQSNLVPLAGLMALYMVLIKVVFHFSNMDFLESELI